MSSKKLDNFDLNKIKQRMAEGKDRAIDDLHLKMETEAENARERSFGRRSRKGFERKNNNSDNSDEEEGVTGGNLKYDNSGHDNSEIEKAINNFKILSGLGFSENEINEVYSQEDLSEIIRENHTRDKWIEISRARYSNVKEKNKSREKDLDVLEEGLGGLLKKSTPIKENPKTPDMYISIGDKKREESRKIILNFENSIGGRNFEKFKNTGSVSDDVLKRIASIIVNKERELTPNERQVLIIEGSRISDLVTEIKKNKILQKAEPLNILQSGPGEKSDDGDVKKDSIKNIFELGYSPEDIKKISKGEELVAIHKGQVYKNQEGDFSPGVANYNPSFEGENQTELQRFQDVILNDENKLAEELKKEKPSKYVVDHYERNINWAKGEIKKLTTNPEDGLAVVETPESKNANPSKQPDTVIELSNGKIKGKITISREGSESYHGASAKDMSKEKSLASLDERIARAENVVRQLDGANSATAIVDGQKELIKKLKAEKEALQNGVDLGASNLENTEEKIIAEIFRMHEDRLVSLGWNLEEFKALDKEERDYVLWMGVKEEDYSRRKGSEASEDLNLEKRIQDFALVLVERKKKTGSFYFAGEDEKSFYRDNKIEISKAVEDLFNKKVPAVPKDAQDFIKSENEKLAKDASELTAKGVSEGAKEFIKGERVLAEEEKERQKFAGGLEKGYENFDKNRLIEIAKARGLASGGDKQQVIDRLIEDDIKNNRDSFGFANSEISEKLREYNMSEKAMVMLSPEFFSLTPEKQRYLISKIEQKIYLTSDLQSKDKNEEEIKGMGFWKKAVATFGKDQRQVSLRDKMIAQIKTKGLGEYGSDITTINSYLLDAPDLKYVKNERGRLVPEFAYVDASSSEEKYSVPKNFFNVAASRFGEVPYEWSSKNATSAQRAAHQRAFESYTSSKEALLRASVEEAKNKNPNISEEEIEIIRKKVLYRIAEVDAQVSFGSYITQNPEMERMTANFAEKFLGTNVGDFTRGKMFFAAGYLTKLGFRSMAMTGVGIAAAAAIGGGMAYRKKNIEFNQKEFRKRYGKSSDDIISIETEMSEKVKEIQNLRLENNPQNNSRVDQLNNEIKTLSDKRKDLTIKSGVKQNINSENIHERLEKLVSQFEKATDEKSKARILETIKNRIFVTDEMKRDGRINFGKSKDATFNEYKMTQLLARATVTVEMNGGFNTEKTEEEKIFDKFKEFINDSEVGKTRNRETRNAVLKGATIGGAGFALGATLAYAQEQGYLGAAWNFISENVSAGTEKIKYAKDALGGVTRDWLDMEGSDDTVSRSLDSSRNITSIPSSPEASSEIELTPDETFKSMPVGSDGMIGGVRDLQRALRAEFGNDVPQQYQEFMAKKPEEIAREWGVYRPGEENESAKVFKGAKFEIGKNGEVRFVDHLGATQKVFAPEVGTTKEFAGDFFNAGDGSENLASEGGVYKNAESGSLISDYEAPLRPEAKNEGYVRSSELKPGAGNSWYEKPVPAEYGYSPVRGSYEFIKDADGKITKIDLSKTVSDRANEFLRAPNKFISPEAAGADSAKIYSLRQNSASIVDLIKAENLLNDSTVNLTGEERLALENKISADGKEISRLTKGAFARVGDAKVSDVSGPSRVTFFDTDNGNPNPPKINPSVSSVSEGADFVPKKEVPVKAPEAINSKSLESPEIAKVPSGSVEKLSSTDTETTYSFKTEDVKGPIRFLRNKDGVIDGLQTTPSTLIKGESNINSILKDNWQSSGLKYSKDSQIGVEKIKAGAGLLAKYQAILKAGGFSPGSEEYKYLNGEIIFLKDKFKDVLR